MEPSEFTMLQQGLATFVKGSCVAMDGCLHDVACCLSRHGGCRRRNVQVPSVVSSVAAQRTVTQTGKVTRRALNQHSSTNDCWVALHGRVYDLTDYLTEHPGGSAVLLRMAGKDGTESFQAVHRESILAVLRSSACVGVFDADSDEPSEGDAGAVAKTAPTVTLESMLSVSDFEAAAQERFDQTTFDYYASAGCDEITMRSNETSWSRVWLRPRVMMDVSDVNTHCKLLGCPSRFPVFISPCAMAGLAHRDAEIALARAGGTSGIIQVISSVSTLSLEDIFSARMEGQVQWFQIYVHPKRIRTEEVIRRAEAAGAAAFMITVDTAVVGLRERDARNSVRDPSKLSPVIEGTSATGGGVVGALVGSGAFDARLSWDDLAWVRSLTSLPIVLKGVQTGEDAVLAAQRGVAGIVVSNHGGRQLDTSRSTLDALDEVVQALKMEGFSEKVEVYVDGGIRRGTDVYKALALGAKAVGIGRPVMYGLAFGESGAHKVLGILHAEFKTSMQLMGRQTLAEIQATDVDWPDPSSDTE
uniref:(S)-2-hydroxy-acid oxidase n=1 Tax=Noctiluca scintillans TaxID=2966 RepID=A0A7S1F5I2_NOCSC